MSLVVIFGPQAVGKMTVGQELCKITDYKLFHNHMAIDMIGQIFDKKHCGQIWQLNYTHYMLVSKIWEDVLEFCADHNENLIFTLTWNFDNKEIEKYMQRLEERYNKNGEQIYFIELECNISTRLKRNNTENRLKNKICKRDIKLSNEELIYESKQFRLNSNPKEIKFKNYIRIDNSKREPKEVAIIIRNYIYERN